MQTATTVISSRPGRGLTITLWALQILAALAFLGAGFAKLSGVPMMVDVFEKVGFGQWFRYLVGALEVLGAIGLVIPRYAFYAAALLAAIMLGAIVFHLTVLGGSPAPPIVLFLLTGSIVYLRRPGR